MDELRAEYKLGASRFDFFARRGEEKILMEVKGCTLEDGGFARFPDAPTLRGLKHVEELTTLAGQGWRCYVMILLQMEGMEQFSPNWATHADFGHALRRAVDAGVTLLAYDCRVTPSSLTVNAPVPVDLIPPNPFA